MTTKIEWCVSPDGGPGFTWNPVIGCSHCSPGCDHCFAERMANRLASMEFTKEFESKDQGALAVYRQVVEFGKWNGRTAFVESALDIPLRRRKPTTYFVGSMTDLFHENTPDEWRDRVFAVMALCPQHRFIVVTKRAQEMKRYFLPADDLFLGRWPRMMNLLCGECEPTLFPLPNLMPMVTVCTQAEADEKIPPLLDMHAACRGVSIEPMLGHVDLQYARFNGADSLQSIEGLHWVICGGETGPGARPMHPDSVRSLRDQCKAAGVPFFLKSWGEWIPKSQWNKPLPRNVQWGTMNINGEFFAETTPWNGHDDDGNGETIVYRVGRKRSGHLLDGVEHREIPEWMKG